MTAPATPPPTAPTDEELELDAKAAIETLIADAAEARVLLEAGDFAGATATALVAAVSILAATVKADGLL